MINVLCEINLDVVECVAEEDDGAGVLGGLAAPLVDQQLQLVHLFTRKDEMTCVRAQAGHDDTCVCVCVLADQEPQLVHLFTRVCAEKGVGVLRKA